MLTPASLGHPVGRQTVVPAGRQNLSSGVEDAVTISWERRLDAACCAGLPGSSEVPSPKRE